MKCKKNKCKNRKFQENVIKRTLKLNNTQIHNCEIDSSLHIDENIRLCKKKLHLTKDLMPKTKSMSKVERFLEAQKVYDKSKNKAKQSDGSKRAKHYFEMEQLSSKNYQKWLKHPNRFDIKDIDG